MLCFATASMTWRHCLTCARTVSAFGFDFFGGIRSADNSLHDPTLGYNVAPLLVEGFGLMKSFRGIIQNQLLFEGFGIMKSFGDRNKKIADSES